ncbi:MAG TPA: Fe-S cluster domain-containing protein [Nitrospirae bacterium]|nr:Fe-S cluster domain-containing protein [Nitrospirota bacterium]HDK16542.1 Fe-S cluster domain-containing protein [Nitrospirota bacterium]HDK41190.1 Fe-S cluster domain-containing protein [Nitrospirota bacterium]HDK82264.1 Fe-S cluster domain-containing protein [Nitrospirota bacterium]
MLRNLTSIKDNFFVAAIFFILLFSYLLIFLSSPAYAGVGGGVEVRESVDLVELVKFTVAFLFGIGAVFGMGLAFAAKKFAVKEDPRIDQVSDFLAHAHCGACGYAGCRQYAEAVVMNPDVAANLCTPGGKAAAEGIARITGKEMISTEPRVARIMCQGGLSKSERRFKYEGIMDCRAAILAGGGDKACIYGCLGYGTCSRVCQFGAITMNEENLPEIDPVACTACGQCAQACPTKVIEIQPLVKEVLVRCHSKNKGAVTRKTCRVGCIACGMCVKVCPYNAVAVENNLARIDPDKCRVCGLCVTKCPTRAILDSLPRRPKAFITEKCNGCGSCMKVCPVNAVSGEKKKQHVVDQEKCIGCGICTAKCPLAAITGTINYPEVLHAYEAKKAAREKAKKEAAAAT